MSRSSGRLIVMTIDALRADRADLLRQSSKRLQADFVQFSALSHGVATPLAFPGIIAGTLPTSGCTLPRDVSTLAEDAKHITIGFSNNGHLNAERGYNRGFDSFGDLAPPESSSILDRLRTIDRVKDSTIAQAVYQCLVSFYRDTDRYEGNATVPIPYKPAPETNAFIRNNANSKGCDLLWAHYMDPHAPYHPDTAIGSTPQLSHEELQSLVDRMYELNASGLTENEIGTVRELYDGNVSYTASYISDIIDWCHDQEWYDQSLIVITGDHGELLGEHGKLTHPWDAKPYDELISVPLFVKFPNQERGGDTLSRQIPHRYLNELMRVFLKREEQDLTQVLIEDRSNLVISASNSVLRATTPDGVAYLNDEGERTIEGDVPQRIIEKLEQTPFPNCAKHSGTVPGKTSSQREEHLKALGYRT